jgi:hypothetical protein
MVVTLSTRMHRPDVLIVPSTVLKLNSKQQTSLNKRRRVTSYVAWVRVGGTLSLGNVQNVRGVLQMA